MFCQCLLEGCVEGFGFYKGLSRLRRCNGFYALATFSWGGASGLSLGAKGYVGVVGAAIGRLWLGRFGDSETNG